MKVQHGNDAGDVTPRSPARGRAGYAPGERLARCLGVVSLVCTVLYALPPTSFVGAILMIGYVAETIVSYLNVDGSLFVSIQYGLCLGVVLSGWLWLGDGRRSTRLPLVG